MYRKIGRRCCAVVVALCLIWLPLVQAQSGGVDNVAPVISHAPIVQALEASRPTVFQAVVTDDRGVQSVVLFYRQQSAQDYKSVDMSRVDGTDIYDVTLPMEAVVEPGLEYYLQAMDTAGNILWRGYSGSPLTANVLSAAPPVDTAAASTSEKSVTRSSTEKKSGGMSALKWVLIAVGVGAVAALAGGGGSGSGGSDGGAGPVAGGPTSTIIVTGPEPQ